MVNVELELPAEAVIVDGETITLKSLVGGGGGADLGPLPHATRPDNKNPMLRKNRTNRDLPKLTNCGLICSAVN
jgi:hypothetical protein